jgi:AcrR family transcriptional regulator
MKKASDTQRKQPKQQRSKAIVEAILEATVRILPKVGSQNVTTKKIAEFAGVSVGSLYQYFPNKESLLGGIVDMAAKAKMAEVQKRIDEIDGKSVKEATDRMVDLGLELFLTDKEKIREIYRQAPALGRLPALMKLRHSIVERLAAVMKKNHPERTLEECLRVSFVAVNSMMGVVNTMLYDEQQTYSIEELSAEFKMMLYSYFQHRTGSFSDTNKT